MMHPMCGLEKVKRHTTVTGNILKTKAAKFFPRRYPGEMPPKFSEGWLTGQKEQHGVKPYKTHGEAGSAPIDEAQQQMQGI